MSPHDPQHEQERPASARNQPATALDEFAESVARFLNPPLRETPAVQEIERAFHAGEISADERQHRREAEHARQKAEHAEKDRRKEEEWDAIQAHRRQERLYALLSDANLPSRHSSNADDLDRTGQWGRMFDRLLDELQSGTGGLFAVLGPRGSGKTQLAVTLARHLVTGHGRPAYYSTQADLSVRVRATWASNHQPTRGGPPRETEAEILTRSCHRPQLLVIDEIGRGNQGEWLDGLLFQIVDYRYRAGRMTLLIGNVEPAALGDVVGASILSRMDEAGGVFVLNECNYRERKAHE